MNVSYFPPLVYRPLSPEEKKAHALDMAAYAITRHAENPQNPPFWVFTSVPLAYEELAPLVPPGSFRIADLAEARLTAFSAPKDKVAATWLEQLVHSTAQQFGLDGRGEQALLMAFLAAHHEATAAHEPTGPAPHLSLHRVLEKLRDAHAVLTASQLGLETSEEVLAGHEAALNALEVLAGDIPAASLPEREARHYAELQPAFVVDVQHLSTPSLAFLATVIGGHGLDYCWIG